MTTATLAEPASGLTLRPEATRAPLGRLIGSELRWMLLRRRTVFALGGLALIPIIIGIGLSVATGSGMLAGGLDTLLRGNGLILPMLTLLLLANLFLPLVASMFAADAIAGESASGTLRGLLVAPIGRLRLLGVKAFGVAVASLVAVLVVAITSIIIGEILFGGTGMLSFSGTPVGFGGALGRIGLAVLWTTVQLFGIGAVALAISAFTEHPLVVMASTLAGVIVFSVLNNISQLSAIHPLLITNGTMSGAIPGLLGGPMDLGPYGQSMLVAACYTVIGLSVTAIRMVNPR
ncbi:ABC transporter permease [Sciscionella sediminilitoris]|uniref:ABC transporter permease n=1 Tax=Sciscionella sediminilitoris TaxID=1445613 RepID=UPI00068CAFF1|nr:ABC transporter permease subunit [Sciscionella sp. SE31]